VILGSLISPQSKTQQQSIRINVKKPKITSNDLQSSGTKSHNSDSISNPFEKKEGNKPWIGIKIKNGAGKSGRVSSTEKVLKIKKTKDGSKKVLLNSSATKENRKTKTKKGKLITKGKSPPKLNNQLNSSVDKTAVTKQIRHYRLKRLSPELAAICGKKKLTRQDVVSRIWRYIKKRRLQDPNQKTTILCDEKLRALTKRPSIGQTDMLLCIGSHLTVTSGFTVK
jgi:chromatin remodeling complex protein RSC6